MGPFNKQATPINSQQNSARESIIIIDNYIDSSVLELFTKARNGVKLKIYTKNILNLDAKKFNKQYGNLEIKEFTKAHDSS
ncbi:MAG: hypothetical protein ACQESF_07420 [Nanobdellota archaeon]